VRGGRSGDRVRTHRLLTRFERNTIGAAVRVGDD
jgi:hypothetical protein